MTVCAPLGATSARLNARPSNGGIPRIGSRPSVTSSALHLLGIALAGDAHRIALVNADVFEDSILLAIDEVIGRRHVDFVDVDPRRSVPHADQPFGMRVGKRLEQHAFDHAEDCDRGAYSRSQRNEGDDGEAGRPAKPSHNLDEPSGH